MSKTFDQITIRDGLSQSSIHSIFQDSMGYMWFGTYDGLNVYDGYTFSIFRHSSSDPASLSNNNIYPIYEDSHGILWIGTGGGGLNRFDRETNTFISFRYDSGNNNSLSNDTVYSILEDSQGTLWIGTAGGGLNIFNRDSNSFTNHRHSVDNIAYLDNKIIYVIFEDSNKTIWLGTNQGIYYYNRENGTYIKYQLSTETKNINRDQVIFALYEDKDNNLWVGTEKDGLYRLNKNRISSAIYKHDPNTPGSISDNQIRSINEDSEGNLWIATYKGLHLFDKKENRFIAYTNNPIDCKSINNNLVRTLYKDRNGILWVGTNNGITKINPEYKKIKTYINTADNINTISHNYIRSIYEDSKKNIWIGTVGGGLNKYDRGNLTFTHYKYNPENPHSISSNNIKGICEDDDGNFWIGTSYEGVNKFIPNKGIFITYKQSDTDASSISSNEINTILKDSQGTIWIGTYGGLNKLNRKNNTFYHYKHDPHNPLSISGNTVTALFEDSMNQLWVGTNKGLNLFDKKNGTSRHYKHEPENPNSLRDNSVSSITEDKAGHLWIGTINGGLHKFNKTTGQFTRYNLENGLINECIYGILIDNEQNIWFSTNMGISKLNPFDNEIKHYDESDGLQSNEFNGQAYLKTSSGEFFWGGIHGLNSFYPEEIKDNQIIPPIVIRTLKYNGKTIDTNFKHIEEIELDWRNNNFDFEFSALNYISSKKNQYSYKLEGFDKQWTHSKTRRFLSYTNIPGGNYILHITGSNNDNRWNSEGIRIKVKVSSPPWKSWWAYCLYIILPLLIISIIIHFTLEQQKHSLFKQFTINIAHEIKTPLTLVSNYLDRYIKNHDYDHNLIIIQKNIQKLKKDMINLFNTEAFKIGKIIYNHNQTVNITASVLDKIAIFEESFFLKHITLQKDIKEQSLFVKIDPLALEEILNNLLENSIKYNKPSGSVSIRLYEESNQSVLIIKDQGIGISRKDQKHIFNPYYQASHKKKNIQGVGLGLFITKRIIDEVQGKISIESEIDKGTQFTISFPQQYVQNEGKGNIPIAKDDIFNRLATANLPYRLANTKLLEHTYDEQKYTLFIVEDNKEMLAYLQDELISDYNVFYGLNGEDALNKLETTPKPDLILSDIMMDNMDGYQFFDSLKRNKKYHSVPFIFLTARTGIENQLIGLEKGAVDFIEKPFSIEIVREKISSLIDIQISKELDVLENIDKYKKKKIVELFNKHHIIPSEQELVICAIQGKNNREISEQLNIQYNSVKTYFFRIYRKCNVKNRGQLINLFSIK